MSHYLGSINLTQEALTTIKERGGSWLIWREGECWDVAAEPKRRVPSKDIPKRHTAKFIPLLFLIRSATTPGRYQREWRERIERLVLGTSGDEPLRYNSEARAWKTFVTRPCGPYRPNENQSRLARWIQNLEEEQFNLAIEKKMDWEYVELNSINESPGGMFA